MYTGIEIGSITESVLRLLQIIHGTVCLFNAFSIQTLVQRVAILTAVMICAESNNFDHPVFSCALMLLPKGLFPLFLSSEAQLEFASTWADLILCLVYEISEPNSFNTLLTSTQL